MAPNPASNPTNEPGNDDPGLRSDVRLVNYKVDQLDKKFDAFTADIKNTYASKGEVNDLREDVKGLRDSLNWVVKSILGAVIAAVLGLILVKGGVH